MRQYLIGSWANADEYDYSGEQIMGNRLGASREVPHFLPSGRANVAKYGDNTALVKKVPLHDRILPQYKRVNTLTEQLIELEKAYKAGEYSIEEYTTLRAVVSTKRARAEQLYKKAVSVKEPVYSDDCDDDEPEAFTNENYSYPQSETPKATGTLRSSAKRFSRLKSLVNKAFKAEINGNSASVDFTFFAIASIVVLTVAMNIF